MKARHKKTGREITILGISKEWGTVTFIAEGVLHQENLASGEWEIIDESEPVDWSSFRREAANAAMSGMMANADFWQSVWSENRVKGRCDYPSEIAHFAIACADELIRQLKQE